MTQQVNDAHRKIGRVAFLANLESIKKSLEEGNSLRSVYADHQLGISYSQFTRYVSRYLGQGKDNDNAHKRNETGNEKVVNSATGKRADSSNQASTSKPAKRGAWQHDANSNKRDDLI